MAVRKKVKQSVRPGARRQSLGRRKSNGDARRRQQLAESRAQQGATAAILKVIARSQADARPVFEAIATAAIRLIDGHSAVVAHVIGDSLHLGALTSTSGRGDAVVRSQYPRPLSQENAHTRAIRLRRTIEVVDTDKARGALAQYKCIGRARGYRSQTVVPLMRGREAIGTISVTRKRPGRLSQGQITLLKTFADQAVIAIENVRLFNETKEALERQTATAEILKVISSSPTDLQPVFDCILENATRLCDAHLGMLGSYDGEKYQTLAQRGASNEFAKFVMGRGGFEPPAGTALEKMIAERQPVQTPDYRESALYRGGVPNIVALVDVEGVRTFLVVPMLKEGRVVGGIAIYRRKVRPFTEKQVDLVRTFADQAVIAIENVRLFNQTKEALERQTATAEILKVIASSPSDVQPVFDAIAASAGRLLGGLSAAVTLVIRDMVHLAASTATDQATADALKSYYPRPLSSTKTTERVLRSGKPAYRSDYEDDPETLPETKELARALRFRSNLWVPLLRDSGAFGTINVSRAKAGPFSDHQIKLLETFASQAVIAIENVRLFNETKESLERQTATAEVLNVISSSPTDVQPVFDVIAKSGKRLCNARECGVFRFDGEMIHLVALAEVKSAWSEALRSSFPSAPNRASITSRAILTRDVVQVSDILADPDYLLHEAAQKTGIRSVLSVPLVREGQVVGAITVDRAEPVPFLDKQVALLQTFANQAVIAIENVRLFKELQAREEALTKSVGQLTALGEVGQALSSTLELDKVLQTIVSRAVQLAALDAGAIYEYDQDSEQFSLQAAENMDPGLVEAVRRTPIRKGDGATGRTAVTLEAVQIPDVEDDSYKGSRKDGLARAGYRAVLAVPLLREDNLLGVLQVFRRTPGEFPSEVVELLKTFATQSAMAIQNARLFREIAEKGKQLEIASRHKSDFLANMSHELRTPLNAIIGFSEVLIERMFGELNEKQADYMKDIHESGRHLLSLINDILDLSKIEAGRMDLDIAAFDLPSSLANAMTLVRERAQRNGIALGLEVDPALGEFRADERKVKQILLNLLSNAVKFTPEGGRVEVSATQQGGAVQIAVKDSGIGIAPEDHAAVFEEFKQVGSDYTRKSEGTGLGLALTRRFVELHGGQIRLESQPGKGSTFTFTLPVRT